MSDLRKELRTKACSAIDAWSSDLNDLSTDIWSHPELAFQEHHAHDAITSFLDKAGFPDVERRFVLDTGFRATVGKGGKPHIAVLCEYDALPEIGHACGHNLIAELGVAASIGVKAALEEAEARGTPIGQLTVLGTPAEEGGGGKIDMLRAGVFTDVDCAMMAHPTANGYTHVKLPGFYVAADKIKVRYEGKASHASGFPWAGVNALDAAVMAYNGVSMLRQQTKPNWRICGVIDSGGCRPNVIPDRANMEFFLRAPTTAELKILRSKVIGCFEGAATATGCKLSIEADPKTYLDVLTNPTMASLYQDNAVNLGVTFDPSVLDPAQPSASTDMGNVSYEVPSIHPMFSIGCEAQNHTRDYTPAAGSAEAQPHVLTQAKALALTAIDLMCQPELVTRARAELDQALKDQFGGIIAA